MDRNSIIGFILIAAILVGFSFYQSSASRKQEELQAHADSIALAQGLVPSVEVESATTAEAPADRNALPAYKDSCLQHNSSLRDTVVTLENSKLKVQFTTRGARPYSALVKDYYNYDSTDLYIFRPDKCNYSVNVYAGEYIQTKDFTFEIASHTDDCLVMRLPFSNGGYIEQKYTLLEDSYRIDNELSFIGMGSVIPRNVSNIDLDIEMEIPRMEKDYKNETQYSNLSYYYSGDKKPAEFGAGGRSGSKRADSMLEWFAFKQQFFSAIVRAPGQFSSGELAVNFAPRDNQERVLMNGSARMRMAYPGGDAVSIPMEFYFGPNHFKTLSAMNHKYEKLIPLGGWLVGWFTRYAIIPMFDFFSRFISSFGLIILLMTLVIKTVVFPLTYKSYSSSAKMSALKPEIDKINEKYPHTDNQQEMLKKQQATMNLYKRAGVSPMGGCLPTLLTFPILWAMFRFFPASIELRQQSFLWCKDLSAYDSIIDYGVKIPILGDHLSLFALLMAVTMWAYSRFTMNSQPNANDPSAASMRFMSLWMMPIMMFFICNGLSAALSYYYLLSQLVAIIQMIIVRKMVNKDKVLERVRLSEGKPMPKSKWQQRLEEAQKIQEQRLREQQKKARR